MASSGYSGNGNLGGDYNNQLFHNIVDGVNGGGQTRQGAFNNVQLQYHRSQLLKRSTAELEKQHQQQVFLRSVKQRNNMYSCNPAAITGMSPISPQTPFDFSATAMTASMNPVSRYVQQNQFNHPLFQQLRFNNINNINNVPNPNLNTNMNMNVNPPSFYSNNNNGQFVSMRNGLMDLSSNVAVIDSKKKLKNQLQELEKELLDDIVDDDLSVLTSSEWSENLLKPTGDGAQNKNQTQKQQTPFAPSPTSSSSSSSMSTTTSKVSPLVVSPATVKQLLVDTATLISEGNTKEAMAKLETLKQSSNPRGDPQQRLTSYMVSALRSRINPVENPPPVFDFKGKDHTVGTQFLYDLSPCFKIGVIATNLAIFEAIKELPYDIHVLDFDIRQASQYAALVHALGERGKQFGKLVSLKITAVITDDYYGNANGDGLVQVGECLKKLAGQDVSLKFNVVRRKLSELNKDTLLVEPDETLVVNFAFKLYKLADESVSLENPRDKLLRLVKGLNPKIVTLVEQEMNCNTASFVSRVSEASSYYLALLESLDSTKVNRDDADWLRVDECLGRKLANAVACEGSQRLERCEVYGKWRARMGMAGLSPIPLTQRDADSLQAKLNSSYGNNNLGFTVKEDSGRISFGWMGRVLTVASAWH